MRLALRFAVSFVAVPFFAVPLLAGLLLAGLLLAGPLLAGPLLAGPRLAGPRLAGPLLPLPAAAGETRVVRDELLLFEIALPQDLDAWDLEPITDKSRALKAHFQTVFDDQAGSAAVRFFASGDGGVAPERGVAPFLERYTEAMEQAVPSPLSRESAKVDLAGIEWTRINLRSADTHITWWIARRARLVYVLHAIRFRRAVDDEEVEEEIQAILETLKLLDPPRPPKTGKPDSSTTPSDPGPPAEDGVVDAAALEQRTLTREFQRLELVKPAGLVELAPTRFDESERASRVIVRLDGRDRKEQSLCLIRVYAWPKKATGYRPIERVADRRIEEWRTRTAENRRKEPEIEKNPWKPPLWKRSLSVKLVAKRKTRETARWLFVECRNGIQYHLEIFVTGTRGEQLWKPQVDAFLEGFKPLKEPTKK